jgi:hypothetical protein
LDRFRLGDDPPATIKSGIIVLGTNIVTSPLAFLAGPILVNMRDVDVLQKNLDFK